MLVLLLLRRRSDKGTKKNDHRCSSSRLCINFFFSVALISCLEAHRKHAALLTDVQEKGKHATRMNQTGKSKRQNNRTEPETVDYRTEWNAHVEII